jgi:hypothetical protein
VMNWEVNDVTGVLERYGVGLCFRCRTGSVRRRAI